MLSPKSDVFLNEILSYVKFSFDKADIQRELKSHISDKLEYYLQQGFDMEEAEQLSINDMGDAKEIEMELNKQHNPIIGWLWRITSVVAALTIIIFGFIFIFFIGSTFLQGNLVDEFPESDIVYKIDLKEQVKIDDRVIRFTNVIYDKNGNMNIFYETYYTSLWGTGWSLGYIGEITDNLSSKYMNGSGQQHAGFISKGVWTVNKFSDDADILIISYDRYNRKFRVEILLKEGENYE